MIDTEAAPLRPSEQQTLLDMIDTGEPPKPHARKTSVLPAGSIEERAAAAMMGGGLAGAIAPRLTARLAQVFARDAATSTGSLMEFAGKQGAAIAGAPNDPLADVRRSTMGALQGAGTAVRRFGEAQGPEAKTYPERFAGAAGGLVPYAAAELATGGAATPAIAAAIGGQHVQGAYDRVLAETGDSAKAAQAALLNVPGGVAMALPFGRVFGKLAGGPVGSIIEEAVKGGLVGIGGIGSATILGEVVHDHVVEGDRADLREALSRGLKLAGKDAAVYGPLFAFMGAVAGAKPGEPAKVEAKAEARPDGGGPGGASPPSPGTAAPEPSGSLADQTQRALAGTEPGPSTPIGERPAAMPSEAAALPGEMLASEAGPSIRAAARPAEPTPEEHAAIVEAAKKYAAEPTPENRIQLATVAEPRRPEPPREVRPSLIEAARNKDFKALAGEYETASERRKLDIREQLQDNLKEFLTPQDIGDIAAAKPGKAKPAGEPVNPAKPPKLARTPQAAPAPEAAPMPSEPARVEPAPVQEAVPEPKVTAPAEPPHARAVAPSGETKTEPGYVYHATNQERAGDIAESGSLDTFPPDFGTEQNAWPDGETRKRSYWSERANNVWQFAPTEGKPVVLRSKRSAAFRRESTGDIYTYKKVPASSIEILTDQGWEPLVETKQSVTPAPNPSEIPNTSKAPPAPTPSPVWQEARPPETPIGIKRAAVEAEHAQHGYGPIEREASKAFGVSWENSKAKVEADPTVTERVIKGDAVQGLSSDERNAVILREKVRLSNERDTLKEQLTTAYQRADTEGIKALEERAKALSDERLAVEAARVRESADRGRGLSSFKMLADKDYSLAGIETSLRIANGGAPLTPEQTATADRISKKLSDLEKQVDVLIAERDAKAETQAKRADPKVNPERKARVLSFLDAQANEARARLAAKRGRAGGGLPFDPQDIADVARIAASHIAHGIDATAQLVKDFGESIRPHIEDILKQARGIHRDAILGDKASKSAPDELGLRSLLQDAAESKLPEKAPSHQVLKTLENQAGVSPEELDWSGLRDFLKGKLVVKKSEVLDFLKQSNVRVEEKALGAQPTGSVARLRGIDQEMKAVSEERLALQQEKRSKGYEHFDEPPDWIKRMKANTDLGDSLLAERKEIEDSIRSSKGKFEQYQLPGGSNYRELLLTLPEKTYTRQEFAERGLELMRKGGVDPYTASADVHEAYANLAHGELNRERPNFTGGHFSDTPNVLAHLRVNDRTTADGKRMLFIEEVQSDWHQKGGEARRDEIKRRLKEKGIAPPKKGEKPSPEYQAVLDSVPEGFGYASTKPPADLDIVKLDDGRFIGRWSGLGRAVGPFRTEAEVVSAATAGQGSGLPDAPFKKTWHELALKRAIRYAAENGYDSVGWTTGEMQVDRYNEAMRQNVDKIEVEPRPGSAITTRQRLVDLPDGGRKWEPVPAPEGPQTVYVKAWKGGQERFGAEVPLTGQANIHGHDVALEDVVGKDIADKIRSKPSEAQTFEGEGLAIGGAGMQGFYDKMLPAAANKIGKVGGAEVGEARIDTAPDGIHGESGRAWIDNPDQPGEQMLGPASSGQTAIHSLPITPALRTVAMEQGLPRFGQEAAVAPQAKILEYIGKQAESARARIKARGPQAFGGIPFDPKTFADHIIIGADYLARDIKTFADWSGKMLGEFGETIKPHLQDIFEKAKLALADSERVAMRQKASESRSKKTIDEMRRRIETGDFGPRPERQELPKTPAMIRLEAEKQMVRQELQKHIADAEAARRTPLQKFGGGIKELTEASRAITFSADASATLAQGLFATLDPKNATKVPKWLSRATRAAFSEKAAREQDIALRDSPEGKKAVEAGVPLSSPGDGLGPQEEMFRTRWLKAIPGVGSVVKGSDRAFSSYLNQIRVEMYNNWENAMPYEPSRAEKKKLALNAGIMTGRGDPGRYAQLSNAAGYFVTAPRLYLSQWQILAGSPFYGKGTTPATRRVMAQQAVRSAIGIATVFAAGKALGGELDLDPRQPGGPSIRFGDTRVNPLGGIGSAARMGIGAATTAAGAIAEVADEKLGRSIRDEATLGVNDKAHKMSFDDVVRYGRGKLLPAWATLANVMDKKDVTGRPASVASELGPRGEPPYLPRVITPMAWNDVSTIFKAHGFSEGAALNLLNFLGMRVAHYEDRKK